MVAEGSVVATIRVAASFERNLDELEAFESEREAPPAFQALLDELFGTVIPALERFPRVGQDFMARPSGSAQGRVLQERVAQLIPRGGTVRLYAMSRHVLLYLQREGEVVLLAIRHHRQLGFDVRLSSDWPE